MKKEMLINVSQAEECRIALLEDGILEELYTERTSQNNWVGNIYKGKIVNIEPSIQAAFVDFGVGRNGFLHISDIEPEYFRQAGYDPADILSGKSFGIDDEDSHEDRDSSDRDSSERDSSRRDSSRRDSSDRNSSRRDSSPRDSSDRDTSERDSSRRDSSRRDYSDRDSSRRDSSRRDSSDRNSSDRNSSDRDSSRRDSSDRDSSGRDSGNRDSSQRTRGPQRGGKLRSGRPRFKPPIQEIFKRGDEVIVQVIKEGIGTKGPTLSTYISIPGRYLVLMPSLGRVGISRKIEDESERKKLKATMHEMNIPKGVGFIVRTAAQERNRKELYRDVAYLLRLWKVLSKRIRNQPGPCDVYEESDIMIRTIRDTFTEDIDSILIDSPEAFQRAKDFMELVMPKYSDRIELYDSREPLFHRYKLEQEIARIHQRIVPLKGGGSIVIDPTEALVAIDVNSGNFRGGDENAEENAFHLNLAATKEIARQLRLRDLGGVIVNDFIDMRKESHRRKVEKSLRDAMKRDRARTKILRTSPFGLIEMTRQRIRPSFKRSVYEDCPCCRGRALVKTAESMAIEVTRILMLACQHQGVAKVNVRVNENVAAYLNNKKRRELIQLEESSGVAILILGSDSQFPEFLEVDCRDKDGGMVSVPFLLAQ